MAKNVESELQKWFEKMEASPGLYDNLRSIEEDGSLGPQQRLQEMFLKRLNGFNIALAVTSTEEFGDVTIAGMDAVIDFDLNTLRANGMTSVLPFTSDRGYKGTLRLDWQHCTMVFVPEQGEPSMYVVNEFLQNWTVFGVGHKFDIGFLCVISPLLDETASEQSFLSNMSLNKMYVEGLIFANREKLGKGASFNPQAGVTFKDVSEVTGVPASTLSNIRSGKKSLENLTWKTLSVLSFYAQIRMLDAHIIDMLRQQLSGERDERQAQLQAEKVADEPSGLDGVVVELDGDTRYRMEATPSVSLPDLFNRMVELYNDETRSMVLPYATNVAGETFTAIMVPKSDIKQIRIEAFAG